MKIWKQLFQAGTSLHGLRAAGMALCCSAVSCSMHENPSGKASSISGMGPGDSTHLDFQTKGCFHDNHYELTFTPGDGCVSVRGADLSSYYDWTLKKFIDGARRPLPSLKLNHADAVKLDHLLEYYRRVEGEGCSTVEKAVVTMKSAGKTVSSERFADASCGSDDRNDIMTIYTLIERMKPGKP